VTATAASLTCTVPYPQIDAKLANQSRNLYNLLGLHVCAARCLVRLLQKRGFVTAFKCCRTLRPAGRVQASKHSHKATPVIQATMLWLADRRCTLVMIGKFESFEEDANADGPHIQHHESEAQRKLNSVREYNMSREVVVREVVPCISMG
jgi:hypothetical protein